MNIKLILLATAILNAGLQSCSSENYVVEMEPSGTKILKGHIERQQLEEDTLFSWYKTNFDLYVLDFVTIHRIEQYSQDLHFVLVVGTWCGDSKREVPHMFKIFDAAKIPPERVLMFGVDRTKKSQDGTTEHYNILRVPTLIVFKGDQEIGRIVEHPRETLEKDLLRILNKQ